MVVDGVFSEEGLLDEEVTEDMLTSQATGGRLRLANRAEAIPLFEAGSAAGVQHLRPAPASLPGLRGRDEDHLVCLRRAPARAPPQAELSFDQTPSIDPAEADPVPEFVFDQSLPDEFEEFED